MTDSGITEWGTQMTFHQHFTGENYTKMQAFKVSRNCLGVYSKWENIHSKKCTKSK